MDARTDSAGDSGGRIRFGIVGSGWRSEFFLRDVRTPVSTSFRRVAAGEGGNLEGFFLRGIMAGDEWVFENGFVPARLSDDEIAIAECLVRISECVEGGPDLYSLAETALLRRVRTITCPCS